MTQPLKVINFEQNTSEATSNKESSSKIKSISTGTKLLILTSLIFALTVSTLYFLQIEIILQYKFAFFLSVISTISFSTFLLGSIRNNEKSYELKVINKNDSTKESSEILLNDSIVPYFQLSSNGDFICRNNALSSLLSTNSTDKLNFFNDFIKNDKIKNHILLKLENKGQLENYRLQVTNQKDKEVFVSMSCKYVNNSKILEGSLTDITAQQIKEKSIVEEIERLKTQVLIAEKNQESFDRKNEQETSKLVHDLKSPLNSIFGFLTLIENQHYETDEELIEFSHNAKIAGEKLLKTINVNFEKERSTKENIEENDQELIEGFINEDENEINGSTIDFTLNDFNVDFGSGPNILLVEDNPMNQKVEIKLLEKVGYNVYAVVSGEEAIEQVKTDKFDLVLMDIDLPGISGLEATQEIRNFNQTCRDIPIIAATAKSSMKDREKCLEAGMNDYISKPINISFMKMTIDQWLKDEVA